MLELNAAVLLVLGDHAGLGHHGKAPEHLLCAAHQLDLVDAQLGGELRMTGKVDHHEA